MKIPENAITKIYCSDGWIISIMVAVCKAPTMPVTKNLVLIIDSETMMQRTSNENAACERRICKRSNQPKIEKQTMMQG